MKLPPRQTASISQGTIKYIAIGEGSPPIVLINGGDGPLEGWYKVLEGFSGASAVFAYNRFGIGGSDRPRRPQDGLTIVADLRELLAAAGVTPPYVLVGHSFGGLYANLFARLHPDEVAGVVLLEASHPGDLEIERYQGRFVRGLNRLLGALSRRDEFKETKFAKRTAEQIECAGSFPDVPLVVVTGGRTLPSWMTPKEALDLRKNNQLAYVRLSPQGRQIVAAGSGHFPQFSEPAVVVQAVRDCLEAARSRE
ncbi:alpha/beta fold hydrolase [Cohnella suwonensis]|uniref:Alpha/beta fold hydrolase n=1 Tax=Cohnella suwonensis TaxID=696072 RepID=A0ABW0LR73_9BACL